MNLNIVVDTNEKQCVNESFAITKFAFFYPIYSNLQNIYCICYILTFIFFVIYSFSNYTVVYFLVHQ